MDPVEIAGGLQQEATELIYDHGLDEIFQEHATVHYTGSYALGLMAWRDLDVHLLLEPDPFSLEVFLDIAKKVALLDSMVSLRFDNFLRHRRREEFPRGLCLSVLLKTTDGNGLWKVDIWALGSNEFAENQALIERIRGALDEESRRLILEIKQSLLQQEDIPPLLYRLPPLTGLLAHEGVRVPVASSSLVYKAVLFEGLRSEEEVRLYLREQGIEGV